MPPGVTTLPPHISLCRQIMQQKAIGYKLNVVTPQNLHCYLPDLPGRVFRIALRANGRWERFFGRGRRRTSAIALRADYVRAFLLERHGGIYIDSDAIILKDLAPSFEKLEQAGFLVTRRSSFGKSYVSVNLYGSLAGGPVIKEYAAALRNRLECGLDYGWNEVGAEMLTPIVDRHLKEVAFMSEEEVQPVTFEEADTKFSSTALEIDEVLTEKAIVFMLYSGPFKGSLSGVSEQKLYGSDRLISKVFRRAFGDAKPLLGDDDRGRLT